MAAPRAAMRVCRTSSSERKERSGGRWGCGWLLSRRAVSFRPDPSAQRSKTTEEAVSPSVRSSDEEVVSSSETGAEFVFAAGRREAEAELEAVAPTGRCRFVAADVVAVGDAFLTDDFIQKMKC